MKPENKITIVVDQCARCGGVMEIIAARNEGANAAVIEAACTTCGAVAAVTVLTEAPHE